MVGFLVARGENQLDVFSLGWAHIFVLCCVWLWGSRIYLHSGVFLGWAYTGVGVLLAEFIGGWKLLWEAAFPSLLLVV